MRVGLHRLVDGDGARTAWSGQPGTPPRSGVRRCVAEVVELMTGEKPGTYVIEIETVYPGAAGAAAREAVALRRQAEEIGSAASGGGRHAGPAPPGDGTRLGE